jgi:hypothetical protein
MWLIHLASISLATGIVLSAIALSHALSSGLMNSTVRAVVIALLSIGDAIPVLEIVLGCVVALPFLCAAGA